MIYLVCFAASVVLAYFANKQQKTKLFWVFSALSILIPVLLAGLRDYSIGVDTNHYYTYKRYWLGASSYESIGRYMQYYMSLNYGEPLFALFLAIFAKIFGNFSVFLVFAHGVIISCVYIGAFRFRKYIEPVWILLLFYLFYFGQSLNIMRQYMAMAIVFAFFADIAQKRYLRYLIVVGITAFLHTSALLALFPPIIYIILHIRWNPLDRKPWFRFAVVVGILLSALILLPLIARLLMLLGILSSKYNFFLNFESFSPAILSSLFAGAGLAGIFLFRKRLANHCADFSFYALNSVAFFLLMQFSWVMVYGKRIAAYQQLPNLVAIAMMERIPTTKKGKWLMRAALLGAGLAYWLYAYVLRNASQTMPYQFVF